jgi:hypothetical protein
MASSPSSKDLPTVCFRSAQGGEIESPAEWEPAILELRIPRDDWEAASVAVNRHELPLSLRHIAGDACVVADWPRSPCGRYLVEVSGPNGSSQRVLWVAPTKLSQEAVGRMISDLEAALPASIVIVLERLGAFAGVEFQTPEEQTVAAEVALLERIVNGTPSRPGLPQILRSLARNHHSVLETITFWNEVDRARRPNPNLIYRALNRASNLNEDGSVRSVIDSRPEPTADVYENRLVRALVDETRARLRRLNRIPAAASTSTRLLVCLDSGLRVARFLDEVSPLSSPPRWTTMVLLEVPPYRAALEAYLELHRRPRVRLEAPGLDAPLDNIPSLYENWCCLQVIAAALATAEQSGWTVTRQRLVHRRGHEWFVSLLQGGTSAVDLENATTARRARVIPQRAYGSAGGLRSYSFQQVPDVVVEVGGGAGETAVWVFDAKYKLDGEGLGEATPLKVDIDKMHTYRESIVSDTGHPAVAFAAIMYPGSTKGFYAVPGAPWPAIEAVRAYPGEEGALATHLGERLASALEGV